MQYYEAETWSEEHWRIIETFLQNAVRYNGIGQAKQDCFAAKSLILRQIFNKNLFYSIAMSVVQN